MASSSSTNNINKIMPTSRMDQLYSNHKSILQRLDDIESRISSRVTSHRKRAMNNLLQVPTSRRSHMRIFISHRVVGEDDDDEEDEDDSKKKQKYGEVESTSSSAPAVVRPPTLGGKNFNALLHSSAHQKVEEEASAAAAKKPPKKNVKGIRKWTLVIEGGLLIKHLDHDSAKEVDARLNAGLPILGCINNDVNDTTTATMASMQQQQNKTSTSLKDQWRGGNSEPPEKEIPPLIFTHLFDKLEVELKIVKQNQEKEEVLETSAITRSGLGAVRVPPTPEEIAHVKKITWQRDTTSNVPDSHAFFITHNEQSEFKPMGGKVFKSIFTTDHISARIKLYRRQEGDDEGNYIPSTQLCNVFFPTFIGKKAAGEQNSGKDKGGGKSKKRKRSSTPGGGGGGGGVDLSHSTSSANLEMNEASNSSIGSIPSGKEAAFASRQQDASSFPSATDDEDKDVHVPTTVTMDEALHAIFFYIRTRELQDPSDLSVINNDDVLTNLFGVDRMHFSSVRGLLLERQLLMKVQPCTQPIIFNYDMTLDGAEPLGKKKKKKVAVPLNNDAATTAESGSRRRSTNNDAIDNAQSDELEEPTQTMMSCDIDIEVPNLYHLRTREILRRTTLRSFEYTSSRIKALRSLMATNVDEETAKSVIGDVVTGKGYAPSHKQALMAIGHASNRGGEAHKAALIDLRTAALIERLEEQTSLARGYWDVVNTCRALGNGKSNAVTTFLSKLKESEDRRSRLVQHKD